MTPSTLTRRRFLTQTLAWSAMAAGARHGLALPATHHDGETAHALILGDWGYLDAP